MPPYKKLFTYWFSVIIYDLTVAFCNRFINSFKLTEQMNGAARSGKQNIVEGSEALQTSLKSGIKLTGVAKASFEELLGDLEDYLRQRQLNRWPKSDARVTNWRAQSARLVRYLSNLSNLRGSRLSDSQREAHISELLNKLPLPRQPEEAANLLLTLCHQATFLLNKQVNSLLDKHRTEGGLTERLYRERQVWRAKRAS